MFYNQTQNNENKFASQQSNMFFCKLFTVKINECQFCKATNVSEFINWFLFRIDFEALSDLDKMRDDHNIHESGIVEILFKKVSFQIIGMSK